MNIKEALAADDLLLVPQFSEIRTRQEVDISAYLGKQMFPIPIISSPMDTVTETQMAGAIGECGGLGIIHRYNTIQKQIELVKNIKDMDITPHGAAIGVTGDYLERAQELHKNGVKILCVDVAHGHHILMKEALTNLIKKMPSNVHLMAGNVATLEGYEALCEWGANSVRISVGSGSICSTRLVSGHGYPLMQSLLNCKNSRFAGKVPMIADGGIRNSGDIVKALAAGADFVMLGSLLAGTDESPGEIFLDNSGKKRKLYRGMASSSAQMDWRGKVGSKEGISSSVVYQGTLLEVLTDLSWGIKSGLSYSGARNIKELQQKAMFVKQTNAGQIESSTHILSR